MPPKLIVIDTQSVLDWLVFRHPDCTDWAAALDGRTWQWVFTAPMRAEFDFVAAKGFGSRWRVLPDEIAIAWQRHAHELAVPPLLGATERLACSDPDDQKFIDLAIAARVHTLVSRDKALLKLSRRALARHGVRVCKPSAWSAELSGATTATT